VSGSSSVSVGAAAAASLAVGGFPSATMAGTSHAYTVTAKDAYGNTATGFTGMLHFSSSDLLAVLPADSALSNGTGTFSATLNTVGTQALTAASTTGGLSG